MSDALLKKVFRFILGSIIIAVLAFLIYYFIDIIIILSVSILISLILNPLVRFLEVRGLNRTFSIFIIFIAFGFVVYWGISFLAEHIYFQMEALSASFSEKNIREQLSGLELWIKTHIPLVRADSVVDKIEKYFNSITFGLVDSIAVYISSLVSLIAILVIIPFITFFLLSDSKKISKGVLNIIPNKYFEMAYGAMQQANIQLGRFVRGWILDAFLVGFMSAVGLSIIGVDYSIVIGVIAGFGHLIPYMGPLIGGIPALVISIVQTGNLSMVPAIFFVFLTIYSIDNGFIQPYVFSKSVDMHPIIIILLIVAGGHAFGILGMLLAVPTATIIRTAAKEIYRGFKNYSIIKS
jgi:predicted PurR-regulated permease PerM